jgi:ribonucleotide reductase beta subunit family protein with ferritin-like domain
MIITLLGAADFEKPNPYRHRGRPMKLYKEFRVHKVEETDAFEVRQRRYMIRRRGAIRGWEKRKNENGE